MWKHEFIPDGDDLYRRAFPNQYNRKTGRFSLAVFLLRKGERELSVDWSEYITAEEASVDPNPNYSGRKFYVGALYAKVPRHQELEVIHAPAQKNRAHSLITGQRLINSKYEVADILAENCRPLITSI